MSVIVPRMRIEDKKSVISPEVACAWLDELSAAFGGEPAWSGDAMRRLLDAIEPLLIPLAHALASEVKVEASGRICMKVPQPIHTGESPSKWDLEISYDPATGTWETPEAIGYDVTGLVSKCQRAFSVHKDLGPLDGATCLAACLGLAFLRVKEDRAKRR